MNVADVLVEYQEAYLRGLLVTLELCACAWVVGLTLGSLFTLLSDRWPRVVERPLRWISRGIEAVPILVLLFWAHYPLQASLGVVISPFITMAVLLSFVNTLNVYGVLSASVKNVAREHLEVARVCGIPRSRIYWLIKLPLALRHAAGALTTAQVTVLHLSIFGSLISVEEIFRVSQQINAITYRPVQVYTGLAVFFLIVCLPLNLFASALHRRLAENAE